MTDPGMPLHLQMILHLDAEDAHREVAGWFAELREKYAPISLKTAQHEKNQQYSDYMAGLQNVWHGGLRHGSLQNSLAAQNNAYLNPYCYGLNPADATANWWPITIGALEVSR